jgi:hypothetical protein
MDVQGSSTFERLQKGGRKVAEMFVLMTALASAMSSEDAHAKGGSDQREQQHEKAQDSKEFVIKDGKNQFTIEFLGANVAKVLAEQRITFNEVEGTFLLHADSPVPGEVLKLEFPEVNGVRTLKVEVSVNTIALPNRPERTTVVITVNNSDGSIEEGRIVGGKLVEMGPKAK